MGIARFQLTITRLSGCSGDRATIVLPAWTNSRIANWSDTRDIYVESVAIVSMDANAAVQHFAHGNVTDCVTFAPPPLPVTVITVCDGIFLGVNVQNMLPPYRLHRSDKVAVGLGSDGGGGGGDVVVSEAVKFAKAKELQLESLLS